MLLVAVYLDKSAIQGIGVYSKNPIPRGTLIWQLDLLFDRLIETSVYEAQTGPVKDYLDRYAYPRRSDPRFIVFEADDARYMNHADDPSCDFSAGDFAFALHDIAAGEELTCNYNAFFEDGFEFLGDR
jgi:SET domain-containing protein